MMEQEYRTALIAGAPSQLARELALWLGERGMRVYVSAHEPEELEPYLARARGSGSLLIPVELDTTRVETARERILAIDEECGGLDLVVAAGMYEETSAWNFSWEKAHHLIQHNVTGTVALLTAVLPRMLKRGRGHLVGISSLAAYRGLAGRSAYSGSKAFISNFMESLRAELWNTPLRITCVYPGHLRNHHAVRAHPEPFALDEKDAAARMGRAILQGRARCAMPWQAALFMRSMQVLPGALFDRLARHLR
ncbi:short-chain dehydrogenase/reductase [Cystobacter fuscus]|uniref:Short-chain dehydrogenase/reductase n=1 Tax=Cystobacter fuscus TaxID=43 RepID=A0A250JFS5_9BACT|nr:SDR family NAD(P)-dependent oxidoreductase [Cystobacter fuscus]ATB42006.1 short-chain dehydrogenase/reductase [Cystobacter fuscus]AYM53507.1 KR domain-containing protein [Cystobacter fuscus]